MGVEAECEREGEAGGRLLSFPGWWGYIHFGRFLEEDLPWAWLTLIGAYLCITTMSWALIKDMPMNRPPLSCTLIYSVYMPPGPKSSENKTGHGRITQELSKHQHLWVTLTTGTFQRGRKRKRNQEQERDESMVCKGFFKVHFVGFWRNLLPETKVWLP